MKWFERNWTSIVLALVYFALCVLWTQPAPRSWNDIARVAAIESWSERGTWAIDDSPWFERTRDKVFLNGSFYSDKMPLLSWTAAGAYTVLRQTVGASLAPGCEEKSLGCAYYPLTLLFIGIPAAVLVALMYQFARAQNSSIMVALMGTLALALGMMILPYSLVLNHHLPAAVSLFVAFYLLTVNVAKPDRSMNQGPAGFGKGRVAWIGFFTALAVALDPLSGILGVALVALTVLQVRRHAVYLIAGALVPLLLTALLDVQIAGTIIPPYLIPSGYDYEGSAFPATVGGNEPPEDLPQYAFSMFLGAQGLFFYSPLLVFALAGIGIVGLAKQHSLRMHALIIGAAFVALCGYLATRTGNLGGVAYGERWFVEAIPLLTAFLFFAPPLARRSAVARWLTAPLFAIALMVSMCSSYQGAQNPWRYVPPPAHPTRDSETGSIGWKWEIEFSHR